MVEIPQSVALLMIFVTTFLWGSWYQFVKRLGKYPISAFMLWLYTFACAIVWLAIFFLKPFFIEGSLWSNIQGNEGLCVLSVICGMMMAIGNQLHMGVVKKVGLIISTSICATAGVLTGTLISCLVGGVPEGASFLVILIATAILISAVLVCQKSGRMRDKDNNLTADQENYKRDIKEQNKALWILVFATVFLSPAYSFAISYSVKTPLKPNGLPAVLCIGLLAIGAFLGTLIYSGIQLTKNKQWKVFFCPEKKSCILMAFLSGFFHFGGNLIYTMATPVISHAIAWPMGTSFNIWTYIWGLGYGEYKGAKKRTIFTLVLGMLLFVAGVLLLASNLYW